MDSFLCTLLLKVATWVNYHLGVLQHSHTFTHSHAEPRKLVQAGPVKRASTLNLEAV
jgi:hypothetical protein